MKERILEEVKKLAIENDYRFITERVLNKSIEVINKIDSSFFKDDTETYATPYRTLVIDFKNNNSELSLEIGYKQLGYFVDGEYDKIVEFLNIETDDEIVSSIEEVTNDLNKLFNNK